MKQPTRFRVASHVRDDFDVVFDRYDEVKNEMVAHVESGEEIRVDPFVSCAWNWQDAADLVGKRASVEGYWHDAKTFIPDEGKVKIL